MKKPVTRPARPAPAPPGRRFTLAEEITIIRVAVDGRRQARASKESRRVLPKPRELLATILPDPLPRNEYGHLALDDFGHFCAFSSLSEQRARKVAFD